MHEKQCEPKKKAKTMVFRTFFSTGMNRKERDESLWMLEHEFQLHICIKSNHEEADECGILVQEY